MITSQNALMPQKNRRHKRKEKSMENFPWLYSQNFNSQMLIISAVYVLYNLRACDYNWSRLFVTFHFRLADNPFFWGKSRAEFLGEGHRVGKLPLTNHFCLRDGGVYCCV
jgi:hypothetical protein